MLAPNSDIGAASPIAVVAHGEAKLPVRNETHRRANASA
jgi:hypothetical protein